MVTEKEFNNVFLEATDMRVRKNMFMPYKVSTNIIMILVVAVAFVFVTIFLTNLGASKTDVEEYFVETVKSGYYDLSDTDKIEIFGSKLVFSEYQDVICSEFMEYDINGRMAIALYYIPNEENINGTDIYYEIRFNFIGFSFGYFEVNADNYYSGLSSVKNGIACFMVENYEHQGFASMNTEQVCEMHIICGDDTEIIEIDSTEPFVQSLKYETSIDDVIFYDVNGDIVEYEIFMCVKD